ncbi:MAG TPA: hypothetical protein VGX03_03960 [Candidatus Binatia bacterium]|jgi:hypothetical protein|nr:hypothetical protein [Candidatus Binatia bacterium]
MAMVRQSLTVRVPAPLLRKLMSARKVKTYSELMNTLLAEEEERRRSHKVLRKTAGTILASAINNCLL